MFYKNEEDAQAVELQNYIKENGPEAAVVKYIGLKPEDRMTKVIVEEYNKLVQKRRSKQNKNCKTSSFYI